VKVSLSRVLERCVVRCVGPSPCTALTKVRGLPIYLTLTSLTTETGGLVVVAKTTEALRRLTASFATRQVNKRYLALVRGRLPFPESTSSEYSSAWALGSSYSNSSSPVGLIDGSVDGKEALSQYRVLAHYRLDSRPCSLSQAAGEAQGWVTAVEVAPLTGRTHQIRRHLQFLGHSIVGDKRYAFITKSSVDLLKEIHDGMHHPKDEEDHSEQSSAVKGQELMYLWSVLVSFPHPVLNANVTVQIAEPEEFQSYLKGRMEKESCLSA